MPDLQPEQTLGPYRIVEKLAQGGMGTVYRADLNSLGIIAFELLSGRVPFDADSAVILLHKHVYDPPPLLRSARPDLPESIESAVNRMLAKQPGERYPTAAAFVAALHVVPTTQPRGLREAATLPGERRERPSMPPPTARLPLVPLLGVTAVLALAVVGALLLNLGSDDAEPASAPTEQAGQGSSPDRPPVATTVSGPSTASSTGTAPPDTPTAVPTPGEIDGTWLVLGGDPTRPLNFNGPISVALDAQGNVYVAEQYNHRISKFSLDGQLLAEARTRGMSAGQLQGPFGLAVDPQGNLLITELYNHRVQRLTPSP